MINTFWDTKIVFFIYIYIFIFYLYFWNNDSYSTKSKNKYIFVRLSPRWLMLTTDLIGIFSLTCQQ